jgi:hypothetical protein
LIATPELGVLVLLPRVRKKQNHLHLPNLTNSSKFAAVTSTTSQISGVTVSVLTGTHKFAFLPSLGGHGKGGWGALGSEVDPREVLHDIEAENIRNADEEVRHIYKHTFRKC